MKSVLSSVRVNGVTLAKLQINGETICEVEADVPDWLPVRPRLNRLWLRGLFAQAIRNYMLKRTCQVADVVKA